MSTREPKLEKDERTPSEVAEPTVMAFGMRAGEYEQASALLLPAATATITPALTAPSTACLKACGVPAPPKLMSPLLAVPNLSPTNTILCSTKKTARRLVVQDLNRSHFCTWRNTLSVSSRSSAQCVPCP